MDNCAKNYSVFLLSLSSLFCCMEAKMRCICSREENENEMHHACANLRARAHVNANTKFGRLQSTLQIIIM